MENVPVPYAKAGVVAVKLTVANATRGHGGVDITEIALAISNLCGNKKKRFAKRDVA